MTDILEGERYFRMSAFGTEKVVMVVFQLAIREMVPS